MITPAQERSNLFNSLTEMEEHPPSDFNKMRVEALRYAAGRIVREEQATLSMQKSLFKT